MTAPIAASDVWAAVMDRAGYRCECTIPRHPGHRAPGRCEADANVRLIAGPRDPHPERTAATAATVPVSDLVAWCIPCWDHAVKSAHRRAEHQAVQQLRDAEGLW